MSRRHLLIPLFLLLSGCTLVAPERISSPLEGSWAWEASTGGFGGWRLTPDSLGYAPVIVFLPGHRYRFIRELTVLREGTYRLQAPNTLVFDFTGTFVWPSERSAWHLGIFPRQTYYLQGDSLLLLGDPCVDCYTHRFRRIR